MGCQNLDNLSYKTFISTEAVQSTEMKGSVKGADQRQYRFIYIVSEADISGVSGASKIISVEN